MTKTSLLDAVRSDMRARLVLIRSLYDLDQALKQVSETVDGIRDETSQRQEATPSDQNLATLAADLLAFDTVIQDLADRLLLHRRAVETALLGCGPINTNA